MQARAFVDTNVLVYAYSGDARGAIARPLLLTGVELSVQALNEFVNVARRKLRCEWPRIDDMLAAILETCRKPHPVTLGTHRLGVMLAERYRVRIYDALMLSAALIAECDTFYSEDLHPGLVVEGRLTIVNPFA